MQMVRDVDIPGRYDRERIIVICPETSVSGAERLLSRKIVSANRYSTQVLSVSHSWDSDDQYWHSVIFRLRHQNDQLLLNLALQALRMALSKPVVIQ